MNSAANLRFVRFVGLCLFISAALTASHAAAQNAAEATKITSSLPAEAHVPPGAASATVTNLMETAETLEGAPLAGIGDVVKVPIHPYEILTIRVDYPNGGPKQ